MSGLFRPSASVSRRIAGGALGALVLGLSALSAQAAPKPAPVDAAKLALGERAFAQCKGCHNLQAGAADMVGPNLYGIYDKKAGSNSATYNYSTAMRAYGVTWDDQTLSTFLQGPSKAVPGTKMPYRGLSDDATRAALVYYIKIKSTQK